MSSYFEPKNDNQISFCQKEFKIRCIFMSTMSVFLKISHIMSMKMSATREVHLYLLFPLSVRRKERDKSFVDSMYELP